MTDLIDRQEAIEALKRVAGVGNRALEKLRELPTAHRPVDERKRGRWIDLRQEGDSRFMCSVCKWKEHVPTCMGEPTVWEYCPSCGARMDGDGNG